MKAYKICALLLSISLLTGCGGLLHKNEGINGKTTKQTAALAAKVDNLDAAKAEINTQKLTKIGAMSGGVEHALGKDTNQSPAVVTARTLNERIAALAEKPDFKELQEIYAIVDTMIYSQEEGNKLLAKKDKEIAALNKDLKEVTADRESLMQKIIDKSLVNAGLIDQYKKTLSQMDSFWGFGAISYGVKKLLTKLAWACGIMFVLYLVLRIAKNFNPIAAAIFGVVDGFLSIFVQMIKGIAPGAVQIAGFVTKKEHTNLQQEFADWKGTLVHVVDAIQMMKEKEKLGADIKMEDIMAEAAKTMDEADKARIDEIKKDLNWK